MLYRFLALPDVCVSVFSHLNSFSHVIFSSRTSKCDWKQKMYTTEFSFWFDFLWNAGCENRWFFYLSIYMNCASWYVSHANSLEIKFMHRRLSELSLQECFLNVYLSDCIYHCLQSQTIQGGQILLFTFLYFQNKARNECKCHNFIKQY